MHLRKAVSGQLSHLTKKHSPSVVTGSIGKLLPLSHAQVGHGTRGTLVIHVLHAAVGHLSLCHEGLATSRHCDIKKKRHIIKQFLKVIGLTHPLLEISVIRICCMTHHNPNKRI